jgi:ABC-2 type transport system ATP-binding protein
VISVENLCKEFNGIKALDRVTLKIEKGEAFGLIGPNGAGKTTLVRILTGQIAASSGEIRFEGAAIDPRERSYRLRIGLVPQEAAFYGRLSARENLELIGSLYGMPRSSISDKAGELLDWSGLMPHAERQVRLFSKGMQQRLSLAMGLMHQPDFLYLDEPTSGLDPEARISLWDLILRLSAQGTAIMMTTHNMEEADHLFGRLAVLVDGAIREEGTPEDIKALLGSDRLELKLRLPDAEVLDRLCGPLDLTWTMEDERVVITGNRVSERIPQIVMTLGPDILNLQYREVTLEDAFLRFMGQVRR